MLNEPKRSRWFYICEILLSDNLGAQNSQATILFIWSAIEIAWEIVD